MSRKTWRYAACRNLDSDGNATWDVRELYSTEPDESPIYTASGMRPFGESLEELRRDVGRMHRDVLRSDLPILDLTGDEPELVSPTTLVEDSRSPAAQVDMMRHAESEVRLRRLSQTDAPAVFAAFESNPDMARQGDVSTLADAERYVSRLIAADAHHEAWAVVADDLLIGLVCVTLDEENRNGWFWYWMTDAARGRGWTSRAAATVAEWALTVRGLERLELGHRVNNPASGVVARRAGFVKEGTERQKFLIDGQRVDIDTYGRLRSDLAPEFEAIPMLEE